MKYHKQQILGDNGDCFRTCIACLMDHYVNDVPHFMDGSTTPEEGYDAAQEWLRGWTLQMVMIPFDGEGESVEEILEYFEALLPTGQKAILTGGTARGSNHCVVIEDGAIIHDPDPQNRGLIGPANDGCYWVTFLTRIL